MLNSINNNNNSIRLLSIYLTFFNLPRPTAATATTTATA